jgi:hypothetical protein
MTVRTEELIRQTFNILNDEEKTPKDLFVSRARLLALTLQQHDRELEDARIEVEVLRQVIEDALGAMPKPRHRHAQGAADPVAILEEALSGYAATAQARITLKTVTI